MNVVIACDTYPPTVNGAATFARELAAGLAGRGHRVTVFAPAHSFRPSQHQEKLVTVHRLPSLPLPIGNKFRVSPGPISGRRVRHLMRSISPDVVHVQGPYMLNNTALLAAKQMGIPTVATNHLMPENIMHHVRLPKALQRRSAEIMWKQFHRTFKQVDALTTPTHAAAMLLRNAGLDMLIQPISNGIDLARFHVRPDKATIRRKYQLPQDVPIFLSVGRLEPEKQMDLVIRGFAQNKYASHLVIAGEGLELLNLKALASKLGVAERVTFTGYVLDADLPDLYAAADVFVMAGIAELQSIVTMEAMATGLPILAADAVALPELVTHNQNGFLFHHQQPEMLGRQMEQLSMDVSLRDRFGAASQEIIQKHNIGSVLDQFELVYRSVISR